MKYIPGNLTQNYIRTDLFFPAGLKLATPWTTAFGTYIYIHIYPLVITPLAFQPLKIPKDYISWGPQIPASHIYKLFPILLTASSPDSPLAVWLYFSLKSLLLTVTEPGCWRRLGPPKVYSRPPLQQTGKQLQARKPVRALFLSPHDYPAPRTKSTPGRKSRI